MARFTTGSDVKQIERDGAPAQRRPNRPSSSQRTNRYAGKCSLCGGRVEAEEGILGGRQGAWTTSHIECPQEPQQASQKTSGRAPAIPDGTYTVEWADHHRTIRVRTQDEFDQFMPGKQLLSYLSGPDNSSDYTTFAHVDARGYVRIWKKFQPVADLREAVKVLSGDPQACAVAFARESGRCWRCSQMLTTPDSIERGMGEICAEKAGFSL